MLHEYQYEDALADTPAGHFVTESKFEQFAVYVGFALYPQCPQGFDEMGCDFGRAPCNGLAESARLLGALLP